MKKYIKLVIVFLLGIIATLIVMYNGMLRAKVYVSESLDYEYDYIVTINVNNYFFTYGSKLY